MVTESRNEVTQEVPKILVLREVRVHFPWWTQEDQPSHERTYYSSSFRASLLATNSLNFPSSVNISIVPSSMKDVFAERSIIDWQVFAFSRLQCGVTPYSFRDL